MLNGVLAVLLDLPLPGASVLVVHAPSELSGRVDDLPEPFAPERLL